MSSHEELPKPVRVTGGCLCGAVRYRLDFPPGHDFAKNVGKFENAVQVPPVQSANSLLFFLVDRHLSVHPVPPQLGLDLLVLRAGPKGLPQVAQCERKYHSCQPERGMVAV